MNNYTFLFIKGLKIKRPQLKYEGELIACY